MSFRRHALSCIRLIWALTNAQNLIIAPDLSLLTQDKESNDDRKKKERRHQTDRQTDFSLLTQDKESNDDRKRKERRHQTDRQTNTWSRPQNASN